MKKILLIAFSFSLLCMAAAEMTAGVPKKETATETILEFTQEANQVMIEKKEEPATSNTSQVVKITHIDYTTIVFCWQYAQGIRWRIMGKFGE